MICLRQWYSRLADALHFGMGITVSSSPHCVLLDERTYNNSSQQWFVLRGCCVLFLYLETDNGFNVLTGLLMKLNKKCCEMLKRRSCSQGDLTSTICPNLQ